MIELRRFTGHVVGFEPAVELHVPIVEPMKMREARSSVGVFQGLVLKGGAVSAFHALHVTGISTAGRMTIDERWYEQVTLETPVCSNFPLRYSASMAVVPNDIEA